MTEGEGVHIYNHVASGVKKGSAYIVSYNDFHSFTAVTDVTLYNINFEENIPDSSLVQLLCASANRFLCSFEDVEFEMMIARIEQLRKEISRKMPEKQLMQKCILSEIIIEMLRKTTQSKPSEMSVPLQRVTAYINSNFRKNITLEAMSKEMSFSPNYLGQMIKKKRGMSFNEYLNMTRLRYACGLLISSDMNIKEIAYESGYGSVEYFISVFKKIMLISPGRYRRQNVRIKEEEETNAGI